MDNLNKLLAEIRKAEDLKKLELETWNPRTRPGMEMRRNQAISALDGLYEQFSTAFRQNAIVVFVTGPTEAQKQFASIARDLAGSATVDAKALYTEVTKDAAASMRDSGRFSPNEVAHVMHALRGVALDLKIVEFERPDWGYLMSKYIPAKDLVVEVQNALVAKNGHKLAAIYLGHLAPKDALAAGFQSGVASIVVTGTTSKQEIAALTLSGQFTSRSLTVSLDDVKVDEEYVRALFTQAGIPVKPAAPAPAAPEVAAPAEVMPAELEQTPAEKKAARETKKAAKAVAKQN